MNTRPAHNNRQFFPLIFWQQREMVSVFGDIRLINIKAISRPGLTCLRVSRRLFSIFRAAALHFTILKKAWGSAPFTSVKHVPLLFLRVNQNTQF